MAQDSTFPLLVGLGAGAAALYFWQRKKRAEASPVATSAAPPAPSSPTAPTPPQTSAQAAPVPQLTGRWVWPVPVWQGRRPVISSGWGSPRGSGKHKGGDIMFKRVPADPFPPGTPHGSKLFVMPDNLPALAASDGVVWSAGWGPGGFSVVIDHGPRKVATYYNHLSQLFVMPTSRGKSRQRVYAGQPLGIIGASPRDSAHLKHLHFGIWLGGPDAAIDPAPVMRSWDYINDPRPAPNPPKPAPTAAPVASPSQIDRSPAPASKSKPPPGPAMSLIDPYPDVSPKRPAGPVTSPSLIDPYPDLSPKPPAGPITSPSQVARNASLQYRPVGGRGEPYPEWVRALDGRSGVYVIREIDRDGTPEVVYVGASTGRLYDTLTRHLQTWRRWKGFWKGQYGEGHDPGLTYDRSRVDVAVRITAPGDALDEEERLIRRLRPRDNLLLQPEEEAIPF